MDLTGLTKYVAMNRFFPVIMSLLFLVILVTSNIYLSRRVAFVFTLEHKTWLYVLFAFIPVFMMAGMIGFSNTTSLAGSIVYGTASVLTGLMLYMLLSFLLVDLVGLFFPIKGFLAGILVFSITLAVSGYGMINARFTRLTHVEVPVSGLEKELSIAHLSDLHLGHFRGHRKLSCLLDMVLKESPEAIVITGDMFDGRKRLLPETLEPLREVKIPVFFIEGNHDHYTGIAKVKELMRKAGVIVLENEIIDFNGLQLIGLNHMRADGEAPSMHSQRTGNSIKEVLDSLAVDNGTPSILLHHSPEGIVYAANKEVDLYLAGHTHGGQMFPITYINDLLFKYNRGLYTLNGTHIFVSQGTGTFGPPMRVGTRSEVVMIRLRKSA